MIMESIDIMCQQANPATPRSSYGYDVLRLRSLLNLPSLVVVVQ